VATKPQPETPQQRVVMGRVAAPYAVKGWLKIQPFTEYVDSLCGYDTWWLGNSKRPESGWREYPVLETKVHGQTLLVQLRGVNGRDAAEALQGFEVAVNRTDFPAPESDEYYWDDLIGAEVSNTEGVVLGKVQGLLETGANDLLQVSGERLRLIPFVDAFVRDVDIKQGRILVEWGADWDKD
jgi:16S rRNA processing protein RimM